eukprot:11212551-Lingulodinium_polyedra.AAC.1
MVDILDSLRGVRSCVADYSRTRAVFCPTALTCQMPPNPPIAFTDRKDAQMGSRWGESAGFGMAAG